MNNDEKNIIFSLNEENNDDNKLEEIQEYIDNLNIDNIENITTSFNDVNNYDIVELEYYNKKQNYFDEYTYYNKEYNLKELIKICEYYGLTKILKSMKLTKKNDIIDFLVDYENSPGNIYSVLKRHKLWAYMEELNNDAFMKNYILWK